MTRTETRQEIVDALRARYDDALYIKGTFAVRENGATRYLNFTQARKAAGIDAPHIERRARVSAYGEWAWVAAFNGCLREP